MAAAAVMAQTLGAAQTGGAPNQIGALPALGSDPLTLYLAKMSRSHLNEIISELKVNFRLNFLFTFFTSYEM